MKYYIIAGEASGDMHGANLMKHLHKLDTKADIHFWGGDKMQHEGGTQVMHYKNTAFMGFVEVVKNLRTILKLITFCKHDILDYKPDAIILIDYPGFNLRIAEWAKKQGYIVYYYISPTVWAWKASRVYIVRRNVRKMFTILPFEKDFYKKYNYDVEYCGHPLLDAIAEYKSLHNDPQTSPTKAPPQPSPPVGGRAFDTDSNIDNIEHKNTSLQSSSSPSLLGRGWGGALSAQGLGGANTMLLLLPGSRKQEIENMLPTMLQATQGLKDVKIVIAGVSSLPEELYQKYTQGYDVEIRYNQTYDLLMQAHAAIVTSGTASLETALFNVPQMIVYKANAVSVMIAKRLVNIKYIGLPNLIMAAPVVKELIQDDFNLKNVTTELEAIWNDDAYRNRILEQYSVIRKLLGTSGASACVAQKIYEDLVVLKQDAGVPV